MFLFTLKFVFFFFPGKSYFETEDVLRVKTIDAKERTTDFS